MLKVIKIIMKRNKIYVRVSLRIPMCVTCGVIMTTDPRSRRGRILDMGCMA